MSSASVETEYWASPTGRREDGIPLGREPRTAEYVSRTHGLYVYAVTGVGVRES